MVKSFIFFYLSALASGVIADTERGQLRGIKEDNSLEAVTKTNRNLAFDLINKADSYFDIYQCIFHLDGLDTLLLPSGVTGFNIRLFNRFKKIMEVYSFPNGFGHTELVSNEVMTLQGLKDAISSYNFWNVIVVEEYVEGFLPSSYDVIDIICPSQAPSLHPTPIASASPSMSPTTALPSKSPTYSPSNSPSKSPTLDPTSSPTNKPTPPPTTVRPSAFPSMTPPSSSPSTSPSNALVGMVAKLQLGLQSNPTTSPPTSLPPTPYPTKISGSGYGTNLPSASPSSRVQTTYPSATPSSRPIQPVQNLGPKYGTNYPSTSPSSRPIQPFQDPGSKYGSNFPSASPSTRPVQEEEPPSPSIIASLFGALGGQSYSGGRGGFGNQAAGPFGDQSFSLGSFGGGSNNNGGGFGQFGGTIRDFGSWRK